MGYSPNPYSILVPFLVFAIGMSHGAQKMNGITQDVGRGMHSWWPRASRSGGRSWPGRRRCGPTRLGFAVLLVIDIQVIRELAPAQDPRRLGRLNAGDGSL